MRITTLLALLCCAATAAGQDSVSKLHGLPGDALDAHLVAEQSNSYVVDLSAVTSSWGNTFGVAPLVKASAVRLSNPDFFNQLLSAQAISRDLKSAVPFAQSSYDYWNTQGAGINGNPARNDPGAPISSAGLSGYQFGFGFAEFGTGITSPTGNTPALNNSIPRVVN